MLILGAELPLVVSSRMALSEADFNAESQKNLELMGDAYTALANKTMAICRKFERRTGRWLSALSYTPEVK
jgi:hypothetical protein